MDKINIELSKEEVQIVLKCLNSVKVQTLPAMEKMLNLGNKLAEAVKDNGNSVR